MGCARRCTERHGTWVVVELHGALCPTRHTAHDSDYQGLRPSHAHASPVPRPDGSVPQRPSDASKLLDSSTACYKTKGQHRAHLLDAAGRSRIANPPPASIGTVSTSPRFTSCWSITNAALSAPSR